MYLNPTAACNSPSSSSCSMQTTLAHHRANPPTHRRPLRGSLGPRFSNASSNDTTTTPGVDRAAGLFRIEHPFHPLYGRELELVSRRSNFGRIHLYYHDAGGVLRAVSQAWTSLAAPDPFVTVSAGRSLFRPDDLLRLADHLGHFDGGAVVSRRRLRANYK